MKKVVLDEIKFLRRFINKHSVDIDYIMNGELEERILKNLEKQDYIVVETLSDVFNKRLKEKGLTNKNK